MTGGTITLILLFSALMIVVSFAIGIWARKKATTAQAYFGGTAMFGPVAVGLSSMAGIASAFAMVGVPGIIYGTGNAMTFWMLSGAAFAMSYMGCTAFLAVPIQVLSQLPDVGYIVFCDCDTQHLRFPLLRSFSVEFVLVYHSHFEVHKAFACL